VEEDGCRLIRRFLVGSGDRRSAALGGRAELKRGVALWARAPGYEWGQVSVDFTAVGEREMLLSAAAALRIVLANLQMDRYEALGLPGVLRLLRPAPLHGDWSVVAHERRLAAEFADPGLRLEGVRTGRYRVEALLGIANAPTNNGLCWPPRSSTWPSGKTGRWS